MPYFVYRITPPKKLEFIDSFEKFRDARSLARSCRREMEQGQETMIRIMFAKDRLEAEKLLSAPRDERVIGED